ncbi:pro-neuregulin-1, membrane-bound isoform isoform X4 [Scyliorhinus torazame]|uniref:pro-neuregulin-1, membrane-bound isoform isoform X4 n=1 Tax=Scyliorhinus torazame TaxID=75743 RepID=UPI003B5C1A3F
MPEKKQRGKGKGKGRKGRRERTKEEPTTASAPKIKPLKSDVVVNEGKKLVLRCEAISGYPQPTFKWYKDGKELIGNKKSKEIRIKKKKRKESELLIRKVKPSHAGEYTCEAVNQQGEDRSISNIAVTPATTSPTPWSGHARPCNESDRHYCVNGGQCFVINGINKLSCQCPNEFTGDRCQNYVMASFYKHLGIEFMEAEELYQKRVLTITGICIALLVVGIMCVVAYCKTKKQRKKLHDRLRQSLRSERNNMVNLVNGPHHTNPPADNVQLANQYIMKNPGSTEHGVERETETSFSTSHYTSTTHHSTTVTHTPSHSWSTGQTESVISDCPSVLVMSSIETSRHTSPINHRGRLNGVAGRQEMLICVRNSRDTPDSLRDSPHSERFVSAMTTPARLSPVDFRTPMSPKSPDSEMSPPVSSLTISLPSVAISPLIEEERPLLLVTPPRQREKRQDPYKQYRNSIKDSGSIPASPLRVAEDDEYETTQEYEPTLESPKKGAGNRKGKRTKANGHISHRMESESNLSSESSSSDSETEDERIGEETPFLSIQNAMATSVESAPAYRLAENRTNSTNRYSTQEELQVRLSNVIANQDPIAV